ncbi:uncharacterized protein LOC134238714, partial [Saccostrea cucullata]|uniref:uncharacterized protein LOC134238714 n=1 Tax=Saccostrea cuccullata TaxID=36930 RepID=UPI002ED08CA1
MVTSTFALFSVLALVTKSTLSTNYCPPFQKHVNKTKCVQISNLNISKLTTQLFVKLDWKNITCINLHDNEIRSIQNGLFSKFINLKILQVKNSPVLGAGIRDGLEDIFNSTRLTTLCLENVGLNTSLVKYIIDLLPKNLWHLIFRNNSIEYFSVDFIRKLKIRTLILSSNKNLNFSIGSIPKTYTWLRTLDLSHTGFFSNSTLCPKNKTIMQNLRNLSLNGNLLRLSFIDRKECNYRKLKHLSLSDCHLEDGLHNTSFFNFPKLGSLNLNGLKNTSKIQLPTFQKNEQLKVLNLNNISYNFPPSDENTAAFKYLTELTKLQMNQWNLSQWN